MGTRLPSGSSSGLLSAGGFVKSRPRERISSERVTNRALCFLGRWIPDFSKSSRNWEATVSAGKSWERIEDEVSEGEESIVDAKGV